MKFQNLNIEDIELIKGAMIENSVSRIATCQECKNTMPIDVFYKDMEKANRLIYLINVLNDVEAYNNMKFYEFNSFEYYALIGAKTEKEAINYYSETVEDIDEEDGKPIEITKEEAKSKFLDVCESDQRKYEAIEEFSKCINQKEPYLFLIDGSLI